MSLNSGQHRIYVKKDKVQLNGMVLSENGSQLCLSWLWSAFSDMQDQLQSVLNAAARLVFSARRSERITPLLRELHWLRVPERVTFRLCVLAYRCLHGTAPTYLAGGLLRTSDVDTRRRLRSADTAILVVPSTRRSTLAIVPSQWLRHVRGRRGTACRRLSGMHRR